MSPFRRITVLLASAFVLVASHTSIGSEVTDQLKRLGLKERSVPLSTDRWMKANGSAFEYLVEKQGNHLVVHEIESRHGEIIKGKDATDAVRERRVPPAVLSRFRSAQIERPGYPEIAFEAGAITYVGTNNGEWGGALYALHEDGKIEKLIPENVVDILEHKGELLVFTGLSHMVTASGTIWRINGYRSDPSVERLTLLPGTPAIVLLVIP